MAKMRVHELAKELEIKSQEIIESLSGTEYEIKSASSNIDDAAQEIIRKSTKNPHQRQKKNLPQRKQKTSCTKGRGESETRGEETSRC